MALVTCANCGEKHSDSLRKCPFCDHQTWPDRCPECNAQVNAGVNLCRTCGAVIRPELRVKPETTAARPPAVATPTMHQQLASLLLMLALLCLAGMFFVDLLTCGSAALVLFVGAFVLRHF